ncbi:hypothetical protein [Saccharothrix coeruleofusca]|uniref:Uncharacterized protein n=1 Tax=Saccharothrix coeruleofusca TaxID=33919 RepID=A0A918EC31_9PSEU|nr:hypothetical protein [Saccharothrix coeruleofusca]MBP2338650.1 Ca2+/Na+ antiporter [Saccharothrix coeruleofusca]GGP46928.1 hypothetical protein GCM10010185_18360 [Saccharothrix coeruleofusca]
MKKTRGVFGLLSAGASAASAFSSLKAARGDKDKLALANALGSAIVAITGLALAIRAMRKDGKA